MTKEQFIEAYIARARAAGFDIDATPDGCVYHPDQEDDEPEWCTMIAAPCDCGCDEKWGMFLPSRLATETPT